MSTGDVIFDPLGPVAEPATPVSPAVAVHPGHADDAAEKRTNRRHTDRVFGKAAAAQEAENEATIDAVSEDTTEKETVEPARDVSPHIIDSVV